MAPVLEVRHVRLRLAVKAVVPSDLTIVEELGDDGRDIVRLYTRSNVLAISTATCSDVVRIDAISRDGCSSGCNASVPDDVRSGVVRAVDVVVVHSNLRVGARYS